MILVMGLIIPLSLGLLSSGAIAFVYKHSNFSMVRDFEQNSNLNNWTCPLSRFQFMPWCGEWGRRWPTRLWASQGSSPRSSVPASPFLRYIQISSFNRSCVRTLFSGKREAFLVFVSRFHIFPLQSDALSQYKLSILQSDDGRTCRLWDHSWGGEWSLLLLW